MKHRKIPDGRLALYIVGLVLLFFAAAFFTSCSSVKAVAIAEADRHLVDQSMKAAALIATRIAGGDPVIVQAALDIRLNAKQLQKVVSPPEAPQEYSPEVSKKAREDSMKAHGGWLSYLWYAIAPVALVVWTVGTRIAAPYFPWITGAVGQAADALIRSKLEAPSNVTATPGPAPVPPMIHPTIADTVKDSAIAYLEKRLAKFSPPPRTTTPS